MWLIVLQKDLKHNRHQRGQKNYNNDDYDEDHAGSDESVSEFDNMQRGDICRSTIFKQSKPDKNLTIAYRSCFGLTFTELAPGQFSL